MPPYFQFLSGNLLVMAATTKLGNPKILTDLNAMPPVTGEPHVSSGEGGGDLKDKPSAVEEKTSDVAGSEVVTDVQKKMKRAERFGTPMHFSEEEKRNSRAERFGTVTTAGASHVVKESEASKRNARAERFGISQSTPVDDEAKKKARRERFQSSGPVDTVEEDKKKARALRFSKPGSKENGNKIVENIAVLGKAVGRA